MNGGKKLSIILFGGDFDKALAAFTLATGSASVNYEVNMFFTFWGLNMVKREMGRRFRGRSGPARLFNFMMGGFRNLPLSRFNLLGAGPRLMTGMMKKNNVAVLSELVEAAKLLKIRFYACEMAMHILGLTKDELIPEIRDVIGVAGFLKLSEGGQVLFL